MKTHQLKLVTFVQRKLFKYYKYKLNCKLKYFKTDCFVAKDSFMYFGRFFRATKFRAGLVLIELAKLNKNKQYNPQGIHLWRFT